MHKLTSIRIDLLLKGIPVCLAISDKGMGRIIATHAMSRVLTLVASFCDSPHHVTVLDGGLGFLHAGLEFAEAERNG